MPGKRNLESAFRLLRELPPEVSLQQIEDWLRQAPPLNLRKQNYWTRWLTKRRFWN